jgi:hypothetical protein
MDGVIEKIVFLQKFVGSICWSLCEDALNELHLSRSQNAKIPEEGTNVLDFGYAIGQFISLLVSLWGSRAPVETGLIRQQLSPQQICVQIQIATKAGAPDLRHKGSHKRGPSIWYLERFSTHLTLYKYTFPTIGFSFHILIPHRHLQPWRLRTN